jgi:hypothetical protein
VAVVAGTSEPLGSGWLERLALGVHGGTVAAVPLVVHPPRPIHQATAHDGLVKAAGVGLRADGAGMPLAVALGAGTTPRPDGAIADVAAGSGAAVLVDRAADETAGGLPDADDLDAAWWSSAPAWGNRAGGWRWCRVPVSSTTDRSRPAGS